MMNNENEMNIPFYLGGSQFGVVTLELTSDAADHLRNEDVIEAMEDNIDFTGLSIGLKDRAKVW